MCKLLCHFQKSEISKTRYTSSVTLHHISKGVGILLQKVLELKEFDQLTSWSASSWWWKDSFWTPDSTAGTQSLHASVHAARTPGCLQSREPSWGAHERHEHLGGTAARRACGELSSSAGQCSSRASPLQGGGISSWVTSAWTVRRPQIHPGGWTREWYWRGCFLETSKKICWRRV